MNKLSGEGLFDERPMTQTSLGRFVLRATQAVLPVQKVLRLQREFKSAVHFFASSHMISFSEQY